MPLPSELLHELETMPRQLEDALALIPDDRIRWKPELWGGCPSETFSAVEQICHLRDIERDGYHVRIQRMLDEVEPVLESLDSYKIAQEKRYEAANLNDALAAFGEARSATLQQLRSVSDAHLARTANFAEYGRLSMRGLVHYLRSHDQQHLAGIQWLAGKIASLV